MTQHGWYRASDGNWYFGHDPRPYAAPPIADGSGGWYPATPAPPRPSAPPARGGVPTWAVAVGGGVLALLLLGIVGATAGDDPAQAAKPSATAAPQRLVPATQEPVATTPPAKRPARVPATTAPPVRRTVVPPPKPAKPAPVRTTVAAPRTDPHFGTCKEAIANGYGGYREGVDPEYYWYRDADNDGTACDLPT